MSIWSSIHDAFAQPDFWTFTAKDFITALIALAAFLTSVTNVWVAYLRRHKLQCDLGEALRIGYGPLPQHFLMFKIEVFAVNRGARPGVITRMAIDISGHLSNARLYWTEVTKTENIAQKGQPRKVWTDFAGFSSPVLVPKYDARLIEAAFWADTAYDLAVGHVYTFRLLYWEAGREKPYFGRERTLKISPADNDLLLTEGTSDPRGIRARHLFLTSTDGRKFTAPVSTFDLIQSEKRATPDAPEANGKSTQA